ncbi:MAG TPA: 16S rRNA (cytosine(1402)-N(4))-methyltransferase RsmH [Chthoniobacteraceae bacterium]|jgi:16S rRNA (cytosine1402-N4)-methyltransferase|nr:16S rRNA (cytosine(1402)-N(4))-methyltransferase RsmH [Chthoniobacteraceae bacterium]
MRPDDHFHTSVLLKEVVEALAPKPGETFVDCTLGGGGHSEALLEAGARVIGLDQDPDALAFAKERRLRRFESQFQPARANFSQLGAVLDGMGIAQVDGILIDLGVSSWQLDTAERGFSFMREGPLDMRMNPEEGATAADLVNTASAPELARIFREYGEEPNARRIATHLVSARLVHPFQTTMQLALAVEKASPRRSRVHPATRVFQALRIAVNRELEVLESVLAAAPARLAPGGRMAIISFHSLEDRLVKEFFKLHSMPELDRPEWPAPRPNPDYIFDALTRKPVIAGAEEQQRNPRSRSAKLRAVIKIQPKS